MCNLQTPLLFIIFNRLETTRKVLDEIIKARPTKLYIASDGPRIHLPQENEIVTQVRQYVLDRIDWDCEVKTLFREKNLGCGLAVSSAITWFFKNEKEGIVLEDDCLPHPSFFRYCEELLHTYREDKRIWHISGHNPLGYTDIRNSYYFAKIMHCWGWAGWADRWLPHYEYSLTDYDRKNVEHFSEIQSVRTYWSDILRNMTGPKPIDTWDYQWVFTIIKNKGLCINPSRNLISNIGYVGTHMAGGFDPRLDRGIYDIGDIVHPDLVAPNEHLVNRIYSEIFEIIETVHRIYVLGIPLFTVKKLKRKTWFYLFGIITVMKIRKKSP